MMLDIQNIKTKIKNISTIKQFTRVVETDAYTNLQKIDKQITHYSKFILDFFSIISHLKLDFSNFFGITKTTKNKKLVVVFSGDKGFSGKLDKPIFKNIIKNYNKNEIDLYCIGKQSFNYFSKTNFCIVGYNALPDSFDHINLSNLYKYIIETLGKYSNVIVNFKSPHLRESYLKLSLFPLNFSKILEIIGLLNLDDTNQYITGGNFEDKICMKSESLSLYRELLEQFIQHIFYGFALQNKTVELSSRISLMQKEQYTINKKIQGLTLSFNEVYHSLITKEVSKIFSSKMLISS